MLELENQLEALAAPPPEPVIPGPVQEEDIEDIQGESGIESGPESPQTFIVEDPTLGSWFIGNKVLSRKSVVL
jgi:hypothetical protein